MSDTTDLTTLGLGVDSTSMVAATGNMGAFVTKAGEAAKASDTLAGAQEKLSKTEAQQVAQGEAFVQNLARKAELIDKTRDEALRLEIQMMKLTDAQRVNANLAADKLQAWDEALQKARDAQAGNAETGDLLSMVMGKIGLSTLSAVGAFTALVAILEKAKHAWMEAQESGHRLEVMIEITGNAAMTSAEHISELATSMQKLTTFDDEKIKDAASSMMKFKSISGDTFDRAIKLSADLATVMKTDVVSAADLVGRAMENSYGASMLRRQGLLTDAQVAYLKVLKELDLEQEHHNALLAMLEGTAGGAAEKIGSRGLASAYSQLKNQVSEVFEALGKFVTEVTHLEEKLRTLTGVVAEVAAAMGALDKFFSNFKLPELPIPEWMRVLDRFQKNVTSPLGMLSLFRDTVKSAGTAVMTPGDIHEPLAVQTEALAQAKLAESLKEVVKTTDELTKAREKAIPYARQVKAAEDGVQAAWDSGVKKARDVITSVGGVAAAQKLLVDAIAKPQAQAADTSYADWLAKQVDKSRAALVTWKAEADKAREALDAIGQAASEKTTPAMEKLIKTINDPIWLTYPAWLQAMIVAMGEAADADQRAAIAKKESIKAGDDFIKGMQDGDKALEKETAALLKHVATLGMTKEQLDDYNISQKQVELAEAEYQALLSSLTGDDAATLLWQQRIREIKNYLDAANLAKSADANFAADKATAHAAEEQARAWGKVINDMQKGLENFFVDLAEHGTSAFKRLWDNFKRWALDALAQVAARAVVVNLVGSAGGSAGGVAGLLGGGGGGGDLLSMGSNASSIYSAGGALGSIGTAAYGAYTTTMSAGAMGSVAMGAEVAGNFAAAGAATAAAGETGAAVLAGLEAGLAAVPVAGWIALAAIVIYSIASGMQKGDAMRMGTFVTGSSNLAGGNQNFQGKSAFGAFGVAKGDQWFSDDMKDDFKKFADAVAAIDNAISAAVGKDMTAKITEALENVKTEFAAGMEHQGMSFGEVLQDRYATVLDTIESGLGDLVRNFDGTGEELAKLVVGVAQVHEALAKIDMNKVFGQVVSLQDVMDLAGEGGDLAKTFTDLVAVFAVTNAALETSGSAFDEVGLASKDARDAMITAAGGLEALASSVSFYNDKFLTSAQKRQKAEDDLQVAFDKIGLTMPDTAQGFVDLMNSMDDSTTAGAELHAQLLALSPAMFNLVGGIEDVIAAANTKTITTGHGGTYTTGRTVTPGTGPGGRSVGPGATPEQFYPSDSGAATSKVINEADKLNQMLALQAQLYAVTNDKVGAANVLAQQRAIVEADLMEKDPTGDLKALTRALWDAQDAAKATATAAQAAAEALALANNRTNLMIQIAQEKGDEEQANTLIERQRTEALVELRKQDPTGALADLTQQLWDLQKAADVDARALQHSNDVLSLRAQIAQATGNADEAIVVWDLQRVAALKELHKADPSGDLERLTQALWDAQDAADAAAKAQNQLSNVLNLEGQIAQVSGNAALAASVKTRQQALALLELNRQDPTGVLAGLTQELWDLQDAANAAAEAATAQAEAERVAAEAEAAWQAKLSTAQGNLSAAYQRQSSDINNVINKFNGLSASLRQFQTAIGQGNLSTLSPEAAYLKAKKDYEAIAAGARAGKEGDIGKLQGASQAYLETSRQYFASSTGYVMAYDEVQATLTQVIKYTDGQATAAERQQIALDKQVQGLLDINDSVMSVASAVAELTALMAHPPAPPIQPGGGSGLPPITPVDSPAQATMASNTALTLEQMKALNASLTALLAATNAQTANTEAIETGINKLVSIQS